MKKYYRILLLIFLFQSGYSQNCTVNKSSITKTITSNNQTIKIACIADDYNCKVATWTGNLPDQKWAWSIVNDSNNTVVPLFNASYVYCVTGTRVSIANGDIYELNADQKYWPGNTIDYPGLTTTSSIAIWKKITN